MSILNLFRKKNDPTIPGIILDENTPYTPFTDELTSENVDMAVTAAIHEIAQPGYHNTVISNDRLNSIMDAMNEVSDGDEDLTFETVADLLQEEGMQITAQEYLAASRLYFS